ncbi:MAG: ATP-dependent DNA helicase RecQ [Marivirga sp.]|jgi:ATP-dependent DNA helicase RecQ
MSHAGAVHTLEKYWGFQAFRPLQEDIVSSIVAGHDTLALLPTGGGKSICFQVPAMMQEGLCLVISPLIALMRDQVEQLKKRQIPAAAIYSGMTKREIDIMLDNAAHGAYKFLYISPERLKTELFIARVKKMTISLLAIDEAHCISQWGYDFRPSYLEISEFRETYPDIPCIALTATATEEVKVDIQEKLHFKEANVFQKSFARDNLSYSVRKVENKEAKLLEVLRKIPGSSVVYAQNRRTTQELAAMLQKNGLSAEFFHAGLNHDDRNLRQSGWINNKIRIIVATNAFGMGIDKPDVRTVIHWEAPDNLEAYYQEAGRAGRDEQKAFAVALYHPADFTEMERRLELAHPEPAFLKRLYQALANFYKIAIGSGEMVSYDFEIKSFCKQFQLEVYEVFQAIKVLEQEGFIQLNEQFNRPSGLHINLSYQALYGFEVANKKFEKLIKAVLRIYGGELYQQVIFINEQEIGKQSDLNAKQVQTQLSYLQQEGIVDYSPRTEIPQLTFLQARFDANKLPLQVKRLADRKKLKQQKLASVEGYLENDKLCRTLSLLQYFGEDKVEICGVCDICLEQKRANSSSPIKVEITILLKEANEMDYKKLTEAIPAYAKEKIIAAIREMDEAGQLQITLNGMVQLNP